MPAAARLELSKVTGHLSDLENLITGSARDAQVIRLAPLGHQVAPDPPKGAVIGFGLGLIAGLLLVVLLESLDTRVRTSDDVGDQLGITLLARLPVPPRKYRQGRGIATLEDDPGSVEAYHQLRVMFDYANLPVGQSASSSRARWRRRASRPRRPTSRLRWPAPDATSYSPKWISVVRPSASSSASHHHGNDRRGHGGRTPRRGADHSVRNSAGPEVRHPPPHQWNAAIRRLTSRADGWGPPR